MATKVFQKDIWVARDDDKSLWSFLAKPIKNKKEGTYFYKNFDAFLKEDNILFVSCLYHQNLTNIQEELNLTNINKPHKIKVKLIFEGLPDNSSNSINKKQENMTKVSHPLERAKKALYYHSDCVLLTKEEYRKMLDELDNLKKIENAYLNLKGAYLDLKGSLKAMLNQFEKCKID